MVAVAGRAARLGDISAARTVMASEAVLLAVIGSVGDPVEKLAVMAPAVVGVPETVHTMLSPGATVVGGDGAQVAVRPAGRLLTEQVALVASAVPPFVQEKEPV